MRSRAGDATGDRTGSAAQRDDQPSRERLTKLENELAGLKSEQGQLRARWEVESRVSAAQDSQTRDRKNKLAMEQAERDYDLNRMAELKYGKLVQLETGVWGRGRALRQSGGMQLLKQEVDEDDIASVVSRWTASRCQDCSKAKRKNCSAAGPSAQAVVGQEEAVDAVADAVVRARSGLKIPTGRSARLSSWVHRCRQDRARPRPGGISLRR